MQYTFLVFELLARFLPLLAVIMSLVAQTENRKLRLLLIGQYAAWFFACAGFGLYFLPHSEEPQFINGLLHFDFLSVVMAASIATIASLVLTFAERNFLHNSYRVSFVRYLALLATAASFIVAANAFLVFWSCWFAISVLLYLIIGGKPEYRQSARLVLKLHLFSDVCLATALALLLWQHGTLSFYPSHPAHWAGGVAASAIWGNTLVGFLFVLAMVSKSALFIFDKWLFATVDAPTPLSPLLHAGIVNVSAILAFRAFPFVLDVSSAYALWIVWAAISAFAGTIQSSVRNDIKNDLVASTSAQMGWTQLACASGNFGGAILHVILHGFYKALLFLTAHSSIAMGVQKDMHGHEDGEGFSWSRLVLPAVILAAVGFWLIKTGGVHSQSLLAVLIAASYLAASIPPFKRIGIGYLALAALTFGLVIVAAGFMGEFFAANMGPVPGWSNLFMTVAIVACVIVNFGLSLVRTTAVGKALYMAALNGFYVGDVALACRLGAAKILKNGRS
jgi:NADH:ubiquinone oxidoreductase subunit 5 (subunit L)/multisubunit Na+/H+ antiporter MnhA subunit